jgi:hypothetical protein
MRIRNGARQWHATCSIFALRRCLCGSEPSIGNGRIECCPGFVAIDERSLDAAVCPIGPRMIPWKRKQVQEQGFVAAGSDARGSGPLSLRSRC